MNDAPTSRRLLQWADDRYGVSTLIEFLRHKEVPVGLHSIFWYYLGGTTLFFFAVQIASGLLLLAYYQPGESTSYESIRYITTKVPFGWLVRSVHCWSAHLMILSLVVHMLSTMMLKAYRPPRELTWVSGFILFSLALGFGFSGYLLPWNELAFFATAVGTDSVKSVPLIGNWLLEVMRGGPDVTINTLYRFFALHICILPILTVGVIGAHLLFIQRQGMSLPIGATKAPRGMKFFPNFALRDLLMWLIALSILLALALFLPYGPGIPGVEWELGQKADPLAPAFPGIKPEWYFLWIYQLLKEFPPHLLGVEGPQLCLLLVTILLRHPLHHLPHPQGVGHRRRGRRRPASRSRRGGPGLCLDHVANRRTGGAAARRGLPAPLLHLQWSGAAARPGSRAAWRWWGRPFGSVAAARPQRPVEVHTEASKRRSRGLRVCLGARRRRGGGRGDLRTAKRSSGARRARTSKGCLRRPRSSSRRPRRRDC
jgi:cytochrome b6